MTAGIYVFPEKVRARLARPMLGRLREYLAWLARGDHPIEAVEIEKVVDVDRAEDVGRGGRAAPARTPGDGGAA